jgi:inorganic pyrophosphatase
MRKYGEVAEAGEEDDYPLYSLVIVREKAVPGH